MYPGYGGGNNDNPMMYTSQNFPQMGQSNQQNAFNPNMMQYGGMIKQSSGGMPKSNDMMGHSHQMGGLKNLSLSQNTSDGSNSQALNAGKKLSYSSGVFIPKSTAPVSDNSYNPNVSYGQPGMQMPQGIPMMQQNVNPYAYPQTSGVVNPIPNMGMTKYPQNVLSSTSPMPQTTSPQIGFNMPSNYLGTSPSPMVGGGGMGTADTYNQQMYFNKSGNTSFITGTTPSFPSSGLSSMDTSFSSNMEYNTMDMEKEFEKIVENIANLKYPEKREEALQELSKKRENYPSLAKLLWYSVGTVAILLQEIVAIYPFLSPPNLSQTVSNKVCNVLGLLQCLALHTETRSHFLNAHIPLFLYPFLNTSSKSKPFENLRVTSLGVIGALVKGDDSDAVNFLVQTEIIPLCLRIMKRGLELSRTVATFIVQKILLDQAGLNYVCQAVDRFYAVLTVLNQMIEELVNYNKEDQRLLRHIIRCYLRLSDNQKANDALRKVLPPTLKDVDQTLITDDTVKRWHIQLLQNLGFYNQGLHPGFN
mmetsp:Transcript_69167/g.80643  ORF Transcript_69167/g.80643 Transcript_69167/m.80643 type:complete len:531 (+) Transcript_69167:29-1621(+)